MTVSGDFGSVSVYCFHHGYKGGENLLRYSTTYALTPLMFDTLHMAAHSFSVRQLNNNYTSSCIQIRKSSNNQTSDIGFDDSVQLDIAAIEAFINNDDVYVVIWYNQTSDINYLSTYLEMTNTGRQPKFATSGVVNTYSSINIPYFDFAGNKKMVIPSGH